MVNLCVFHSSQCECVLCCILIQITLIEEVVSVVFLRAYGKEKMTLIWFVGIQQMHCK